MTSSRDFDGVEVVVDRMSAPYLDGATIDFADTIEKQGFTIDNPNAGSSLRLRRQLQLTRPTAHAERPGRRGRRPAPAAVPASVVPRRCRSGGRRRSRRGHAVPG